MQKTRSKERVGILKEVSRKWHLVLWEYALSRPSLNSPLSSLSLALSFISSSSTSKSQVIISPQYISSLPWILLFPPPSFLALSFPTFRYSSSTSNLQGILKYYIIHYRRRSEGILSLLFFYEFPLSSPFLFLSSIKQILLSHFNNPMACGASSVWYPSPTFPTSSLLSLPSSCFHQWFARMSRIVRSSNVCFYPLSFFLSSSSFRHATT